jgi:hypothetical protein
MAYRSNRSLASRSSSGVIALCPLDIDVTKIGRQLRQKALQVSVRTVPGNEPVNSESDP